MKLDKQINIQNKISNDANDANQKYLGGSSFNYVLPSTGVTVLEDGKQKKGTESYYENFGKMSKYDYEKLKKKYNSENFEIPDKINKNRSGISNAFDLNYKDFNLGKIAQKEIIKNISKGDEIIRETIVKSDFTKLKKSLEPINVPNISNRNPLIDKTNIINENIFKNRKVSDMKKKRKESHDYNEMNNFNLNLINNWGSNGIDSNFNLDLGSGKISAYLNNESLKPIISNRFKDSGLSQNHKIPRQRLKGQIDNKITNKN